MISIRRAVGDDRDAIRAWRNDPATRRASLNPDEIAPAEHAAWYADVVDHPARRLYIGEIDEGGAVASIGMVRFDLHDDGHAEVSINLDPRFRGRRLSRPLLESAIAAFEVERGRRERLVALIRTDNPASSRIFQAAGFVSHGEDRAGVDVLVRPAG